jgi:hypothetical protein
LIFYICKPIPTTGAITLLLPYADTSTYASFSDKCSIFSGLTGSALSYNPAVTCILENSLSANARYLIKVINKFKK